MLIKNKNNFKKIYQKRILRFKENRIVFLINLLHLNTFSFRCSEFKTQNEILQRVKITSYLNENDHFIL